MFPRPGSVLLGRYRLEAEIGRGGNGRVFRAFDRELEERVAVKVLGETLESARDALASEVRLARRITHPNVCRIHDVHSEGELFFLVMELIVGRDLAHIEPPSALAALEIGRDIARGLGAAHAAGVVHRDLKPRNVLVAEDGRVLITDFGTARMLGESSTGGGTPGARAGTPFYAAPEQFTGARVTTGADVFALGVILYELLTGENPFGGGDPVQTAMKRVHGRPSPPNHVAEDHGQLLMSMLERDPADRPTAEQVAEALHEMLESDPAAQRVFGLRPPRRVVAVLPFHYRGGEGNSFLGEGIAEELVDALSGTRGLSVISYGITGHLGPSPPREALEPLGADVIVSGSVQSDGTRVRVRTRVSDVAGRQTFRDGFTSELGDLFEMQSQVARRIAESLRMELEHLHVREQVPPRAMSQYLRARQLLRAHRHEADAAAEMLAEAVELAPHCGAFLASHALASARTAAFSESLEHPAERRALAKLSLDRALVHAAEFPDTQLALALRHRATGDLHAEVEALRHALRLAPTSALAHSRLGEVVAFTRHRDAARDLLERAYTLDPFERWACRNLARLHAFAGEHEQVRHWMALALEGTPETALLFEAIRMQHYTGDHDYESVRVRLTDVPAHQIAMLFTNVAMGVTDPDALHLVWAAMKEWWSGQTWLRIVAVETMVELFVMRGWIEPALDVLEENEDVSHDADWFFHCPTTQVLHGQPRFDAMAARVLRRADKLTNLLVQHLP